MVRHFSLFIVQRDLFVYMGAVTAVHLISEVAFTSTQELIVGQTKAFFRALSSFLVTHSFSQAVLPDN